MNIRKKVSLSLALSAILTTLNAQETTNSLNDVTVVSASGFEQNIADAPASISVITAEELQKKSYTDVIDAVKNIPGVYVSGGGASQDITIRGMSATYTLYLVDGRPISSGRSINTNGTDGGKTGANLPPIDMIERIEIIRGPMSSLYGSEAMGGVINIITKKAADKWSGSITTEYAKSGSGNDINNDSYNTSLFLSGPIIKDKLSLSINGAFQGTDESDLVQGSKSSSSEPEVKKRKIGTELSWKVDEQNNIKLGYDFTRQEYTTTPGKSIAETASGSYNAQDKDVYVISHQGNYNDFLINTYYQYDKTAKIQSDTKKEDLHILNTQATYFYKNHVITFGGQYKEEEFTDETNGLLSSNIEGAVESVDRWIGALFIEDEWSMFKDFALTTGIRYNDDELFGGELSPRIYGVYHATDNLTIKGGVSTGYRQPTLSDATEGFGRGTGGGGSPAPHPRALIIGNEDLEPEKSVSYEIGVNYYDDDLGLNSSLMVFQTDYKDKIAEDRYCDNGGDRNDPSTWGCSYGGNNFLFLSTKKNIDKAQIRGVEISLDYEVTPTVTLNSSYTYTKSEQKSGDFEGEPLNKMPKHMFNLNLDWQATNKWSAWTQFNYRGKTSDYLGRTSMSEGTPGYGFADAGLVYKASKTLQFKAGIYNLTNKEVTNDDYGVVLDGRRYIVGMNVRF
ncbi:TonB-dependent receptor domain-containing protein [Halarcobacter anaerophilus]|jgi:outer membrane receptor for ferrienterochelin and colicins|uniref:TonB-dependent receptor n=1 Tax=Halarcobacter anaerophilus TaxID=877500 RepID=A0A4Q0XY01_9BACT|nr:TonB-dependent receptor [Halarcobacter anaerophilus]QDF28086.1 TonB-dependent receptor [Halarcobacter anaerophilus]RXJ62432.1 TonB-dependent receptor [Halarcobacter anaerophilus]